MFGSYEQLRFIQTQINQYNCDFIKMSWNSKTFQGAKVRRALALDLKDGVMIRVMGASSGMKTSWEFWHGLSKETVLRDDPSDGFDLPNYTTSFDKSKFSKRISKALREFK